MLVNFSRHAKKCSVILAIEKIKIRAVGNSNANNPDYEKILHIRLRLEPSHCFHNALSVCHRIGSIRQSVANATQVEALAKLRRGGTQKVRVEHVHVYPGGQAIVGNVNQIPGAGGAIQNEQQPHAASDQRTVALTEEPAMWCADPDWPAVSVAQREGQEAMPNARRRARIGSTEGEP